MEVRGHGTPSVGLQAFILKSKAKIERFQFNTDPYCGGFRLSVGHDGYRDGQQMHDGSSPAGRDRSSSLQGMDMASLPPRKRPWQDGPGTGDPRERDSAGSDGGESRLLIPCPSALVPLRSHDLHTTTSRHAGRPPPREEGGYGPGPGGRGGWGPGGGPGPRRGGPASRGPPRGGIRGR